MNELKRLVNLIGKYGNGPSPLLNLQSENSLETKLFNTLKSSEVKTDDEISYLLYGEDKPSSNYRMLKSRFRKKLYNHLLFLKLPSEGLGKINEAKYQCSKLITEAYGLRLLSETKLSIKSLEQALTIAEKYSINSLKLRVLEEIKYSYYSLGDLKNYEKYSEALQASYRLDTLEREAQPLFEFTMMCSKCLIADRRELTKYIPDVLEQFRVLWENSSSSKIFNSFHRLNILYLELQGRYAEIADAIEKAEKLVITRKVNPYWFDTQFNNYIQIYALLQSQQYKLGLKLAEVYKSNFEQFTPNWFAFMENYLLLALYSKKYIKAADLLQEVAQDDYYANLQPRSLERWELYRRYLKFMIRQEQVILPKFELTTFKNELPIIIKDKSGFNLAFLILDVLESMEKRQLVDFEQQAERVRKYRVKYLKGENAERPRLFMRLLQLALLEQDPEDVSLKGLKLLKQLKVTPFPGDAFSEVEIIPYEHLWELVLTMLQNKQAVK